MNNKTKKKRRMRQLVVSKIASSSSSSSSSSNNVLQAPSTTLSPTLADNYLHTPQEICRSNTSKTEDNDEGDNKNENRNLIPSRPFFSSSPPSSSPETSPPQQQNEQVHVTVAIGMTTAKAGTSQKEVQSEPVPVLPPRPHNFRLDLNDYYGNFNNYNINNNRDSSRNRSQQEQQQQQQQQKRIKSHKQQQVSATAANVIGIPKSLELVHRKQKCPMRPVTCGNGGAGNSNDDIDCNTFGDDDYSIVSEVTMDHAIRTNTAILSSRPGPERNNNLDDDYPNNNNITNISNPQQRQRHYRRSSRNNDDNDGNSNKKNNNNNESINFNRYKTYISMSEARISSTPTTKKSADATASSSQKTVTNSNDIKSTRKPHDSVAAATNDNDKFPLFMIDDYDYNDVNPIREQNKEKRAHSGKSETKMNHAPASKLYHNTIPHAFTLSSSIAMDNYEAKKEIIDDLTESFQCLNFNECNPDSRIEALNSVANTIWNYIGDRGEFIMKYNVIEMVTKSIWADMEIIEVQEAAINLLFVIATSTSDNSSDNNTMCNVISNNESICDSILFSMQNHNQSQSIQLQGCLIFAFLAATSLESKNNADGSLSGAMTMVLNAMCKHGGSLPIRKAGLETLHHQCLLSIHQDDNKKRLIESKLENGMSGIDVITYAMEELQQDLLSMQLTCELIWCLTTRKDILKELKDNSLHQSIVSICRYYLTDPAALLLIEYCTGAIANLSYLNKNCNELIDIGAFKLVLDVLLHHENELGISYEATLALGNLVLSKQVHISDAVTILVGRLPNLMNNSEFFGETLRVLACVSSHSEEAKEIISVQEVIDIVHQCNKHEGMLEPFFILIACLVVGSNRRNETMIQCGVIDILLNAMKRHSANERIQDAACLAFRNMLCQTEKSDSFLKNGTTSKFIVSAMEMHTKSLSIQTNACCIFWGMLSKTDEKDLASNPKAVDLIIKAMQKHIESAELLELACVALWTFVDTFDNCRITVGKQAIDPVICAMVMHPNTTSMLENACGLLSNLSLEKSLAEAIRNVQGVNIVAETMCNNDSSITLMELGCLILKSIISVPAFAQDVETCLSLYPNSFFTFYYKAYFE